MNTFLFSDIYIGQKAGFKRKITPEMENAFRDLSGDDNPMHKDDEFANQISGGKYRTHIVFGMLTASLYSTIAGMYLPGKYSLIHSLEDISFIRPVFCGDVLSVEAEVIDKIAELKLIILKVKICNQDNKVVSKAKMKVIVNK